jgi:hypothetical protein
VKGCYAFNREGLRCDKDGGHEGLHALTIEWDDADLWTPETAPVGSPHQIRVADGLVPLEPAPDYDDTVLGRCVVCRHSMHAGECRIGDCDCRAGVEG